MPSHCISTMYMPDGSANDHGLAQFGNAVDAHYMIKSL